MLVDLLGAGKIPAKPKQNLYELHRFLSVFIVK